MLPVLLYECETWTLTRELRQRLNSFGARYLRRIIGYSWSDFVSDEWLLRETQMRFVTCIVCERQRLYGHVARFPDADPAHQILSAREPHEWRRHMVCPLASSTHEAPSLKESAEWDQHQENEPHIHTVAANTHGLCR